MTLVEVVVSLFVLLVAVAGALGSVSSSAILGESNRETAQAYRAAQAVIEQMQDDDFRSVFAMYNADPADDPGAPGTADGSDFTVVGLVPQAADADGAAGQILFPVTPGAPPVLREDLVDAQLGMPRDLNADGVVDGLDHSADYLVLPVRVRVQWTGRTGGRFVELQTLLRNW